VNSWEELERREPVRAKEWFDRVRKVENSYCKKMGLPSNEMLLKESIVEAYNTLVMEIDTLHRDAILGDVESIFRLSSYYLVGEEVPKNQEFAFRLLKYAAEQGFEAAFHLLGECYAKGLGTNENLEESVKWILRSNYSEDADLLAILGMCYCTGIGLPQDEEQGWHHILKAVELGHRDAFHLCKAAAEAGNVRSQYHLGRFYLHGTPVPVDVSKALHWLHLSAQQNYAPAQCQLGILYNEGGHGIEINNEAAIVWYRLAAAQNDVQAKFRLGHCYALGRGVQKNKEEAGRIWKEIIEVENHPIYQWSLGQLLTDNEYTGYNPREGIKLLRKAAAQGLARAQNTLGLWLSEGLEGVVKQNWKEARFWFRKAALQENEEAQYYLGEIFLNGNGVQENRKEAFAWYRKSADNGNPQAAQKLAWCYLNGVGTRKNEEEGYTLLAALALRGDEEALTLLRSAAMSGNAAAELGLHYYYRDRNDAEPAYHWLEKSAANENTTALCEMGIRYENLGDDALKFHFYRRAAEKGDAIAQTHLSLSLENCSNRKAPENEEAFHLMQAAALQDYPAAHYFIGNFYRDGTWVEEDEQKAFEHYSKAAAQGNSDGIERLGECYLNGVGVTVDTELAFLYFQQAAEMHNPKAELHLGLCYLMGNGCQQDIETAFQWISLAVGSAHPAVMGHLQQLGLNLEYLGHGCQQYQQLQSRLAG